MEIGYEKCEVASLDMEDFVEGKSYRLVVQRSPLKDKDGSRLRNLSPDPLPSIQKNVRRLLPPDTLREYPYAVTAIGVFFTSSILNVSIAAALFTSRSTVLMNAASSFRLFSHDFK